MCAAVGHTEQVSSHPSHSTRTEAARASGSQAEFVVCGQWLLRGWAYTLGGAGPVNIPGSLARPPTSLATEARPLHFGHLSEVAGKVGVSDKLREKAV